MACAETRVRRARELKGLTRRELANRLDVTYQYLQDIETGKYRPGMKTALKLARELNLSLDFIACDPAYESESRA